MKMRDLISNLKFKISNFQEGMSVIEVVLAAAIFVIFASSAVRSLLQNYNANRTGAEYTIATQFASEGLEAVRSIKNQSFASLVNTSGCGLVRTANLWAFQTSCTNNTLTHNSSDNYIRTIKVESVNRNAVPPAGDIVPAGSADPSTKKITSTVTWNFSAGRPETMSLVTYLSDWAKAIVEVGNGILVYGDTTAATLPKYRFFTDSLNTFNSESSAPAGTAVAKAVAVKTSPTKREAVAGYVYTSGATATLQIMCFDGTAWTNDWSVVVNSAATANTKKFAISYETASGDVMVAYSRNTTATNSVDYRTKSGSAGCGAGNWAAAASLPTSTIATTGNVQWAKMASDPRSGQDNMVLTWADSNSDLGAAVWSGSAWSTTNIKALETALEVASAAQDVDSFEVQYETVTGNIMVVWGSGGAANANGAWYNRCVGGSSACTWTAARTAITAMANDATSVDLAANPTNNDMVFASIGNGGSDLQIAYWNGTTWSSTNGNDLDNSTATPVAGTKMVSVGWLINGATTRSITTYSDVAANNVVINWVTGDGANFTKQADCTTTSSPACTPAKATSVTKQWRDIVSDPVNKDRLLFIWSDTDSDLFAKRLVMSSAGAFTWSNSDGSTALEASLGQAIAQPFVFAYWRNP